jgi:hypothetical protein
MSGQDGTFSDGNRPAAGAQRRPLSVNGKGRLTPACWHAGSPNLTRIRGAGLEI